MCVCCVASEYEFKGKILNYPQPFMGQVTSPALSCLFKTKHQQLAFRMVQNVCKKEFKDIHGKFYYLFLFLSYLFIKHSAVRYNVILICFTLSHPTTDKLVLDWCLGINRAYNV